MCIFCCLNKDAIIMENKHACAIPDKFPKTKGHTLIIPKRHSQNFFHLTNEELIAINDLLSEMEKKLSAEDPTIKGFNIHTNVNEAAGQSIMHTHFHIIPRRENDGLKALA